MARVTWGSFYMLDRLLRLWSKYEYGTATVSVGYRTSSRYKARRHRGTGKVQIWCREWLPVDPDHHTVFAHD